MKKVHILLSSLGFASRPDYDEIIRWAGKHQAEYETEDELLEEIYLRFDAAPSRGDMLAEPRPYRIWSSPGLALEQGAIDQLETALRLSVAIGGAGMPDLHVGYSLPIGGVVLLEQAISPAFVGYDISCMMMLTIFDTPASLDAQALNQPQVRNKYLNWLLKSTSFGLGSESLGGDHPVMDDKRWQISPILKSLKDLAFRQLGSSGAGNHFADIVSGEYANGSGQFVALMTHSGSRGIGNKLAHYYATLAEEVSSRHAAQSKGLPEGHRGLREVPRGYPEVPRGYPEVPRGYSWFELHSDKGQEYLHSMELMGDYAHANHEMIHERFARVSGLRPIVTYWNRHNYAWAQSDGTVLHRKGATPAEKGQFGIIPGSSGSESFLVVGKGNAESYQSASHGAGRPYSRTQAKKVYNSEAFTRHMQSMGITHHGIAADETVTAYKDIHEVISAQSDLVDVVATLRPRVVVMGGNRSSDDGD